jgi:predicted transcriptional regulator
MGAMTTHGRGPGPARLGDLERAVMEVLWAHAGPVSARDVARQLSDRDLAYTTVKTVLDRLSGKGLATRETLGRAWGYRAAASRDAFIAELMLQALELAGDRDAALVQFAGAVTTPDADVLRGALRRRRRT